MRLFTRLIVCAAAAMLLSVVLFHIAEAWSGEKTSVIKVGRQLMHETRRTDALVTRGEMIARSLSAKRDIIDELLAGRLSFRQAIVRFHKANELVENVNLDLIPVYRKPSDMQGVGRQVFTWARNSIVSWPADKAQRFLAELEREYQTLFDGAKLEEEGDVRSMDMNPTDRTQTSSAVW